MGITLPYTFVSGAARTGAEVQANLEAVRKYINGRIVQTDVPVDTVNYRHIQRPEHFGKPTITSQGISADLYGARATIAKAERSCHAYAITGSDYVPCAELSRTITIERSSWVRIRARWYVWGPYNAIAVGANTDAIGVVGMMMLFINDTPKASTKRRIDMHDFGMGGVMPCDKNEQSMVYSETLAPGRFNITIKVRCVARPDGAGVGLASPINPINDAAVVAPAWGGMEIRHLYIESRTFTVEVDPTF